jgi:hypothetical protein
LQPDLVNGEEDERAIAMKIDVGWLPAVGKYWLHSLHIIPDMLGPQIMDIGILPSLRSGIFRKTFDPALVFPVDDYQQTGYRFRA